MNAVRWLPRGAGRGRLRSIVQQTALAALLVLSTGSMAGAAIEKSGAVQTTPVRLGFVEGEVLFWRPGAGDWETAQVNIPLAAGDALAARNGKLELQIGRQSFIRGGDGTQLRLKSNEPDFVQVEVDAGYLTVDTRELRHDEIEIDTPNAAIAIRRDGYYRVDITNESTRVIVRRGGEASVTPLGGTVAVVATGDAVDVAGTTNAQVTALAAPAYDEWDQWNYDRTEHFEAAPRSYAVSSDVYGTEELEQYGSWRYVGTYGRVWAPSSVPAGWAPYSDGRWIWDPLYGYSWVDYSPWGWAPFHYGRWVYPGYWAWAPGPVLGVPVYSPALVGFFGGPGFSVGFSVGVPFVSWVALGWGEPLIPWWGGAGFIGVPCWHGWGGPHVVNNVVINNNTVINANTVNLFRNTQSPNGLVGVPRDQFNTRSLDRVRLTQASMSDLNPIRGQLPVAARGPAAGEATKMPMPDLKRQLTDARPNGAGAPSNFSRQGGAQASNNAGAQSNLSRQTAQSPNALQRAGVPPVGDGGAKTTGNTALDALRRGGPSALSSASRADPAVSSSHATDLRRSDGAPALPSGAKGGAATALDSFRRGGGSPNAATTGRTADLQRAAQPAPMPNDGNQIRSNAGAFGNLHSAPPPLPNSARGAANDALRRAMPSQSGGVPNNARTTDFGRTTERPSSPAGIKSDGGNGALNNFRSSPPPLPNGSRGALTGALRNSAPAMSAPGANNFGRSSASQLPAAGKPGPAVGSFSRLRTQPPAVPQMNRANPGPQVRSAPSDTGAPAAPSRRFAAVPRQMEQRSVQRPSMPSMDAFRGSSARAAAPAPGASMPGFSRGSTGGSVGGGHAGGFGGGGGGSSLGRSMGHMSAGGKLGR